MLVLPAIAYVLLLLLFQRQERNWQSAVLAAAIAWGALLTVVTESLSLLSAVHFVGLSIAWALVNIGLCFWVLKTHNLSSFNASLTIHPWRALVKSFDGFLLVCVVVICVVLAAIALRSPPNNWDSMAYTLPRVVHWIQNHSVAHYPTHYTAQLYNNPWAEFALLHLHILSGGDYFANLLQWFCLVGSLVGVAAIAKELGASGQGQVFAVVLCATLPNGILQASNAKNTYVVAFWLVCFVYYGLIAAHTRLTWKLTLLIVTSLSLAILSKGTAYAFALPFAIWFFYLYFQVLRFKIFRYLIPAIALFLLINSGHYLRNLEMFGSPTSTYPYHWGNEVYTIPAIVSNIIKNSSLHWFFPVIFDSHQAEKLVIQLHNWLWVDPQDPKLTLYLGGLQPAERFTLPAFSFFEDTAGNPLHFWLLPCTSVVFLVHKRLHHKTQLLNYFLITLSSFLIFAVLIKWQPWHSRLHLPVFVLLCPVFGAVLNLAVKEKISHYLLLLVLLFASPYLVYNELKPLIGEKNIFVTDRVSQYFAARFDIQADYENAAQVIQMHQCQNVGLLSRPDAWEYPLWVLLNQQTPTRLEHVNVQNLSHRAAQSPPYKNFNACAIVSIGQPAIENLTVNEAVYTNHWRSHNTLDPMQVFIPVAKP